MFDKKKTKFWASLYDNAYKQNSLYKTFYRKLSESSVNRKINEF